MDTTLIGTGTLKRGTNGDSARDDRSIAEAGNRSIDLCTLSLGSTTGAVGPRDRILGRGEDEAYCR